MIYFQLYVLGLLFSANLLLFIIAWRLSPVNQSIRDLRASIVAISITTQDLMKEHTAELQKARLRVR